MSNRYADYDLDLIQANLKHTEWEKVLPVFADVRLATVNQIEQVTGLSQYLIKLTLRAMLGIEQPATGPDQDAQPHIRRLITKAPKNVAYLTWKTKGEAVYQLGAIGAALLREMGLVTDLRPARETRPLALAQSLCILDVVLLGRAQGLDGIRAERVFTNGSGQTIRADLAVPAFGAHGGVAEWRLIEIEQGANEDNHPRRLERLRNLRAFFDGPAGPEPVSPEVLVLFNVKAQALRGTLDAWRVTLAEAVADTGQPLPCPLAYAQLAAFVDHPQWSSIADYPVLTPATGRPKQVDESARWIEELNLPFSTRLLEVAHAAYACSRGDQIPVLERLAPPYRSVYALRRYFRRSENIPLAALIQEHFMAIHKNLILRNQHIIVGALDELMLDVVLRQHGLDLKTMGPGDPFRIGVEPAAGSAAECPAVPLYSVKVWFDDTFWKEHLAPALAERRHWEVVRDITHGLLLDAEGRPILWEGTGPESLWSTHRGTMTEALQWTLTALWRFRSEIDLLRTNRRRSSYELAARIAEERAALREAHSV